MSNLTNLYPWSLDLRQVIAARAERPEGRCEVGKITIYLACDMNSPAVYEGSLDYKWRTICDLLKAEERFQAFGDGLLIDTTRVVRVQDRTKLSQRLASNAELTVGMLLGKGVPVFELVIKYEPMDRTTFLEAHRFFFPESRTREESSVRNYVLNNLIEGLK